MTVMDGCEHLQAVITPAHYEAAWLVCVLGSRCDQHGSNEQPDSHYMMFIEFIDAGVHTPHPCVP